MMYEIWSLGHKPFEGYTNQQVIIIHHIYIATLNEQTLYYITVFFNEGSRDDRQWLSPASTPWLSQGTLQCDDPVLVCELETEN